jgi:molybdopterin/thiamine biosynthesis adenylyltransferase
MNVIERVNEALEIHDNHYLTIDRDQLKELLHLAKLGQAALKTIQKHNNDIGVCTDCMLKQINPKDNDVCNDGDGCIWLDFCKLRKEQTP